MNCTSSQGTVAVVGMYDLSSATVQFCNNKTLFYFDSYVYQTCKIMLKIASHNTMIWQGNSNKMGKADYYFCFRVQCISISHFFY